MIYHFDAETPEAQSTTIVFPVKLREREIPVITNGTLGAD